MDFNANQMRADALIPEGIYDFEVLDAREKRSGSGNDMLNLKLRVMVNNRAVTYWDCIVLMPKMFYKVEHFCKTTGMPEKIEQGRLMAQDCLGKQGQIHIVQKVDNQTGELGNQTKDYVKPEEEEAASDEPPFFDDELKI